MHAHREEMGDGGEMTYLSSAEALLSTEQLARDRIDRVVGEAEGEGLQHGAQLVEGDDAILHAHREMMGDDGR